MDNETRADRGKQALDLHQKLIGDSSDLDMKTAVSDLLSDLMHLARRRRYSYKRVAVMFYEAIKLAEMNFEEENRR